MLYRLSYPPGYRPTFPAGMQRITACPAAEKVRSRLSKNQILPRSINPFNTNLCRYAGSASAKILLRVLFSGPDGGVVGGPDPEAAAFLAVHRRLLIRRQVFPDRSARRIGGHRLPALFGARPYEPDKVPACRHPYGLAESYEHGKRYVTDTDVISWFHQLGWSFR